jgi:hypothetical protein
VKFALVPVNEWAEQDLQTETDGEHNTQSLEVSVSLYKSGDGRHVDSRGGPIPPYLPC